MKWSQITGPAAISLVCASGMAHADNVTIYGIVDVAVEHVTNANAAGASQTRMGKLTGAAPSRIGFRGREDLGGGYSTVFVLESGFQTATGNLNNGARLFGRAAYVGLDTPYGRVTVGRQPNMTLLSVGVSDIIGPALYSLASLDSYLPNAITDNTIAYIGSYGGFTGGATYSFGRDTSSAGGPAGTNCPGESAADHRQCTQWTAMAKYETAQYGVVLTRDEQRGGPNALFNLTSSAYIDARTLAGAWVKYGELKVAGGLVARTRHQAQLIESRLWYIGASYPITTQFQVDAQVARNDVLHSADDSTMIILRGTYFLSKRTKLYVMGGSMSNSGLAANPLSGGGTVGVGKHQNGVLAGIQTTF